MFQAFNQTQLDEWNRLTAEQQEQRLAAEDGECTLVVDVEVMMEMYGQVQEKHQLFQIPMFHDKFTIPVCQGVAITKVSRTGVDFELDVAHQCENFSIAPGGAKTITVGDAPYEATYYVKVLNVHYGRMVDL